MRIIGTGSKLPEMSVTNDMLANFLDTSDQWIQTRTGIHQRRLISGTESLTELANQAAIAALNDAGCKAEEMDFLICSNVANNYVTPAMSCIIQGSIGATCPCVDLNGACAGFIYALDIADAFIKSGKAKKILIVCAEEPSKFCNWKERDTSILFGDGAGAVVVSEGEGLQSIRLTASPKKDVLFYQRKLEATPFEGEADTQDKPLVMSGRDVFKLAVTSSIDDLTRVLEMDGMKPSDIDIYLLHQANMRIIDSIRTHLDQPESKFPSNIDRYGNTSSASIPILMDEMSRSGKIKDGDTLALSAFGAGFVTGACILKWNKKH